MHVRSYLVLVKYPKLMIEHGIFEQLLHRDVNDDGNYRNQLVDVSSDSLLLQAVALIDHFLVEEGLLPQTLQLQLLQQLLFELLQPLLRFVLLLAFRLTIHSPPLNVYTHFHILNNDFYFITGKGWK